MSGLKSTRKIEYRFANESSVPEKIVIGKKTPDAVPAADTYNRGFECIATMQSELAYCLWGSYIDLPVKDTLLLEDILKFLTLRVFFLRIENHFCHMFQPHQSLTGETGAGKTGGFSNQHISVNKTGPERSINWTDTYGSILG
jgi:hypothetical protein